MNTLHDLVDNLKAGKVWEPAFKRAIKTAFPSQSSWLLSVSRDAVCFDMGNVENVPKLSIIPDLFRMPYPVTWFEGQNRDGILGILACEVGERLWHVAVLNKRMGIAWQLVCIVEVSEDETKDLRCRGLAMVVAGSEADNDDAFNYSHEQVSIMAQFVMALNCVNTRVVEHPAPRLINTKRKAKGRQPIYSYWTLHLPGPSDTIRVPLGGTHASPRLHLRRGHIRQYLPGKYTWVDACVVGNKTSGMVAKDYAWVG